MALSKEEFSALRKQGLSIDQIMKFDGGNMGKTSVGTPPVAKPLQVEPEKSILSNVGGFFKTAGMTQDMLRTGATKGALSTLTSIGQLGAKALSFLPGQKDIAEEAIKTGEQFKNSWLKPTGAVEKAGFIGEQIGEFMLPIGVGTKFATGAGKIVTKAPKAIGAVTKLGANMIGDAAEFAGKTFLQTAGDLRETGKAAVTGLAAAPITKAITAVGKGAVKWLPEKLYSQIFKRSADDLKAYYKSVAGGKEVNPTLAKEALEKGIMGNSENMAVYSLKKLNDLENQVQSVVGNLPQKSITLPNKNAYINMLDSVSDTFRKGFYNQWAKEAKSLSNIIRKGNGNITIGDALRTRRFIDSMRNQGSFRLDAKLGPRIAEYRDAANLLREKISQNPELKYLMNEERIFIEAVDSIVDDAVRRQNKALLGLTDVLLGGGGLAAGATGAGVGVAAGVRAFQQPVSLTGLGQILYKGGKIAEKSKIPQIIRGIPKAIPPLTREND